MASPPSQSRSPSPAVTMAALVLGVLADASPEPMGPSAIGRRLGVAKSSVANICTALVGVGFARREGTGYVLGQRLAELGSVYLDGVDELKVFQDVCAELLPASRETVQIAALGPGLEVTHLAGRDGTVRIQLVSDAGHHLPATCTATGKALLAALPEAELDRRLDGASLIRCTPRSITDPDRLREDLAQTRARGYSVDDQELIDGMLCIGAVVPHAGVTPTYAVSITSLRAWITPGSVERLGRQLLEVSEAMARRLGHGSRLTA
ncbi:MAG TPA: IclR family transcriptional regulator [Acidimicrobiales bacterium]|nr:IclR family transcriptional regulator [Acidimicrobiales bacterium]